jgi:hypothetical protein
VKADQRIALIVDRRPLADRSHGGGGDRAELLGKAPRGLGKEPGLSSLELLI